VLLRYVATKPARTRKIASVRALRCSACDRVITDEAHAIERGGAHAHTFTNPFGIVHQLRCFARAPGVIVECRGCRGFIGWRCRGGGEAFYGLLAERLVSR